MSERKLIITDAAGIKKKISIQVKSLSIRYFPLILVYSSIRCSTKQ